MRAGSMNLSGKKLWIFDVDNTLILDVEHPNPFDDALKLWNALEKRDVTLAILTNVGRLSGRQVHEALKKAGFNLPIENVYTAGAAAAAYIHNRSSGARCFIIGEGGAQEDFVSHGLDVTNNPPIDYVAVGADRGMTFQELNFATKMVNQGARLICISGSRDYPGVYLGQEDIYIGERSIVAAIEHATGVEAIVVGKPLPEIVIETVKILGFDTSESIIIGDNPRSDVAGGKAAGVTTVLVQRDPDNIVDFDSGDLDTTPDIDVTSLEELIEYL
ncbi:MAG: HAD-IIA family hydrolase [Candidatus Thorarchaeota archaeon]|nr:HAD-IIA family hydrolase [Candidatus Thorarchaeota archaeon]